MRMLCAFLLLFALSVSAEDVRDEIAGRWVGDSICTGVRPACKNEIASYRISRNEKDPSRVTISMNKMVNGEEEVMGVTEFVIDAAKRTLTAETMNKKRTVHIVWRLEWEGTQMKGTASQLPDGQVIRNISLKKE